MMLKVFCFMVGAGLLVATCHANIVLGPGYGSSQSFIFIGIAAGLAVGAIGVGAAWSEARYLLAVLMAVALFAGEIFALGMTAERVIVSREAKQAPLRAAEAERETLTSKIAAISILQTTPRLEAALTTQRTAQAKAAEDASKRYCRKNCVGAHKTAVEAAAREVSAARVELAQKQERASEAIRERRKQLSDLPAPMKHSPLADRLQVEPWKLDLAFAGLGSLAANGLGALLLCFAAHAPGNRPRKVKLATHRIDAAIAGQVNEWAGAAVRPDGRCVFRLAAAHEGYLDWCERRGRPAGDVEAFAAVFAQFIDQASLPVRDAGGEPTIRGARLMPTIELKALPAPVNG